MTPPEPSASGSGSGLPDKDALREALAPIAARVAALDPAACTDDAAATRVRETLEAELPFDGETVGAIRSLVTRGVAEGWLCDRGDPSARFCRLAKPGPQTHGLSVDIVALQGAALRHTHPSGEITMAFPDVDDGTEPARFDGHPPGWVVMPAGSTHTPTVTGGRMHLLYFLPDGAVTWHKEG